MSKELEMLKDLKNAFIGHCIELKCETNYIRVCEDKFGKIEKELKALDILKAFDFEIEDYTEYEHGSIKVKCNRIIVDDEEIDLLKEVLKDE